MELKGKHAVIYGGAGAIGGAVARAFAREGATVHLAGRTQATLDAVANDIRAAGGTAHTATVDALDEAAVDAHMDAVAAQAGGVDICMNVIAHPYAHGTPLAEMALRDFMDSIVVGLATTFLTSRAAARHMIPRRSGVILAFGGDGDPMRDYYIGSTQITFTAIEGFRRQLATELGPHNIRVVTLRTGGIPESIPGGDDAVERMTAEASLLGRAATLEDVGHAAVFAASDRARTMTAATINISCGALLD